LNNFVNKHTNESKKKQTQEVFPAEVTANAKKCKSE